MCYSCNVKIKVNIQMEPIKNKINVDPDYESNNCALRKIEEKEREENQLTSEKLSKIISEEFDRELSIRQKHLEDIEEKICKAQKLLHLVRYVLVTSYYNKKSLEYTSTGEECGIASILGAQNRIHPAVKKLLGNNSSLEILSSRGKRRAQNKTSDNEASTSQPFSAKKIKLEKKADVEDSSKVHLVDNNQNSFNRKKTRHRIIIGNISKWMPSLENDNTTHKWMVYVRGLEETLDISHIIEKVVFYLHPSYKPHDVVEISNCPFHLSRRGWGEFPLRVQIFFKCPLNKPVSIVHNLKLDKTYTGRQTLGNETVVDLYLHNDYLLSKQELKEEKYENSTDKGNITEGVVSELENNVLKDTLNIEVDEEPGFIKTETDLLIDIKQEDDTEPTDLISSSIEHNYCHEETKLMVEKNTEIESVPPFNLSLFDHSYSLPYEEYSGTSCDQYIDNTETNNENEQQPNNLIFGLDDSYRENETYNLGRILKRVDPVEDKSVVRTFTTATGQPIRFLPQSFNNVLLSNGNIVKIKLLKQPQSFLKNTDTDTAVQPNLTTPEAPIDYEKYKVTLPRKRFKNLGEALPYLFTRMPLWNRLADDTDFKCTYPFIASSKVEFMSWNVGKMLNSEWNRAKAIKKIVSAVKFPYIKKWNTKTFFMYAKSHGYSPFASFGTLFRTPSMELELLMSCFSKSLPREPFSLRRIDADVDVTADVEPDNDPLEKTEVLDISDKALISHSSFIREAALDCGVVLKSEEILDGVVMNAAERMILEAVRCFAEHLIRRARHHLACREDFSEQTSEVTVEEIKIALNERSELRSIVNFQKKKREMEFFL